MGEAETTKKVGGHHFSLSIFLQIVHLLLLILSFSHLSGNFVMFEEALAQPCDLRPAVLSSRTPP